MTFNSVSFIVSLIIFTYPYFLRCHLCDAFSPSQLFGVRSTCIVNNKNNNVGKIFIQHNHFKSISSFSSILNEAKDSSIQDHQSNNDVREMILTLSLESDDEKRRSRLSSLLEEKLKQSDDVDSAKFAHLWDTNIIQIGGEVQNEARAEAASKPTATNGDVISDREKSQKEKQLWAMVDMMIQSKSIIKKIMNESSEGFQ